MAGTKILFDPSLEKQLLGHKKGITALDYSPDSQQIVTSSLDNSVVLWSLHGDNRILKFHGHKAAVTDIAFSPVGNFFASGSFDRTVGLWMPTGSVGTLKSHLQAVRSVHFSSDGSKILTASDDEIMKLWCSRRKKVISSFVGHNNWISCARISNDMTVIASCSDDKTVKIWSAADSQCVRTINLKGLGICLAWHPLDKYIAVGQSNGIVNIYDTRVFALTQMYSIHMDKVTGVAFHPSGDYIISSSNDRTIKIVDLFKCVTSFTLTGHIGGVNTVRFSPSGNSFASGGSDRKLFLWKTNPTELPADVAEIKQDSN